MREDKRTVGKSQVAQFDWSLTEYFGFLTGECRMPAQAALAEIERAIGAAELPHRFLIADGKLATQNGSCEFWRSDVALRLHDAEGREPTVEAWPRHMGWTEPPGDVVRVPSQIVQRKYLHRKRRGSLDQDLTRKLARKRWPQGWQYLKFSSMEQDLIADFKTLGRKPPRPDTMRRALGLKK